MRGYISSTGFRRILVRWAASCGSVVVSVWLVVVSGWFLVLDGWGFVVRFGGVAGGGSGAGDRVSRGVAGPLLGVASGSWFY